MKYCSTCGSLLHRKELEHEGMIPYCDTCKAFKFPGFNTAVSMIVLNPNKDKILLIQQYGKKHNVLVAGYVNKGESLEETLVRELKEEIGLQVLEYQYLKSEYFEKTNTLMCSYVVVADQEDLSHVSCWEVDQACWYSFEEARSEVKPCSLAQRFLYNFLKQYEKGIKTSVR